ncbi:MAG: Glyco-trans-2-like domain-containing protein [Lachnoclostridium sp.]|jgi:glycosyltransferase involved in cell wall biosynthesis
MVPLVSIIVPIYNSEKTLSRCIDSILNQTYKEFELILLNDGSTDSSGQICDMYAGKDRRIRVIHKENTGVSDTRNQGIAAAKGEYLQFVDSDDWITPDATELFVGAATEHQCDMVIADFYRVIGERVSHKGAIEQEGIMDRVSYATYMMQKPADFYYGVLWNKFYKRSIVEKYQLKMDDSISWCEDFIFNLEYIRNIQAVYVMKIPVYYYVKTKGSLVSQGKSVKKTIQMKRTVFAYYNNFYKDVFGEEEYEKKRGQIYRFLIDAASDGKVALPIKPGNYWLGSERTYISESIKAGEGFLFDIYREQKLLEKLLEEAAIKNEISIVDVKLLYFLSLSYKNCTFKEIAAILNITRKELNTAIQKLLAKDLIEAKEKPEKKAKKNIKSKENQKEKKRKLDSWDYVVTPSAGVVLSKIKCILNEFEQIQYEGFSEDEMAMYKKLNEKRNQNIRKAL